ncbi:hypothetical protein N9N08_00760 [bacterium]|jgi:hypothetical protein|nr:hypothetical protein [bacterium]
MSTHLTKALEFANYRVTLNNQQSQLKAKTQSLLSYSINGGTFTIDVSLINFCKNLVEEKQESVVLLDIYKNPIKIDVASFYEEIRSRYFEVTNEYFIEYEKLRKARKVHKVLDLNEKGE